ncbi:MAG: hypothetical protein U9P00_09130 [Pseudomonadota bacterium]|nr:hypothetical protein [Pseudomonadota bacterium]
MTKLDLFLRLIEYIRKTHTHIENDDNASYDTNINAEVIAELLYKYDEDDREVLKKIIAELIDISGKLRPFNSAEVTKIDRITVKLKTMYLG